MNKRKAIAIAKDVLEQLNKMIVASGTTYYEPPYDQDYIEDCVSAQDHIDGLTKNCTVCALGACLLSYVRLYNDVKIWELRRGILSTLNNTVKKIFGMKQMQLIESAFEGQQPMISDFSEQELSDAEVDAAINFGERYVKSKSKLRAIMKNIIANGGVFKPGAPARKRAIKASSD